MARRLLTSDLISEVRSIIDEANGEAVDTNLDIIPSLNRAQDACANILSRHYEPPLLKDVTIQPTAGVAAYDIPEDALEDRIEQVEVVIQQHFYALKRISYRDAATFVVPTNVQIPAYYYIKGRQFVLVNSPSGSYPLHVWYLRDPLPLALEQGRITTINSANNYIIVDEIGSQLTQISDSLDSYANLIDGDTGLVKGTMQIQNIAGNKITFKTSPVLPDLIGQTVLSALPSDLAKNDYICVGTATCIPFLKKPLANYMIQYAVAEMTKKMGGPADMEYRVLDELEKVVKHSWVGRQQAIRVKKVNARWGGTPRRYLPLGEH